MRSFRDGGDSAEDGGMSAHDGKENTMSKDHDGDVTVI
jgi:hypothetical protein